MRTIPAIVSVGKAYNFVSEFFDEVQLLVVKIVVLAPRDRLVQIDSIPLIQHD